MNYNAKPPRNPERFTDRFRYVARQKDYAIVDACHAVGVSKQGYYAWRARHPEEFDAADLERRVAQVGLTMEEYTAVLQERATKGKTAVAIPKWTQVPPTQGPTANEQTRVHFGKPMHPHQWRELAKKQKEITNRGESALETKNTETPFQRPVETLKPPRKSAIPGTGKSPSRARASNSVPVVTENTKRDPVIPGNSPAAPRPRAGARVKREAIPPHEAVVLLRDAAQDLGVQYPLTTETKQGKHALKLAAERLAEGFTLADLRKACRTVRQRWQNGERWAALRNFSYVWGASLGSILAAGAEVSQRPDAPSFVFRTGEGLERWREGLRQVRKNDYARLLKQRAPSPAPATQSVRP